MPASQDFPYDVFLSHSAKDMAVVRPLAERLRKDGQQWKAEGGMQNEKFLPSAFFLHPSFLEAGTFGSRDPLDRKRRFIPLRLDDAIIVVCLVAIRLRHTRLFLQARNSHTARPLVPTLSKRPKSNERTQTPH